MSKMQDNNNQEIKVEEKENIKKESSFKWFLNSFIWLAIILFIIDVITKFAAYYNLTYGESIKIPGLTWLVQFTLTFNTGAAWGLGGNNLVSQILLCILSYIAGGAIIFYYTKKQKELNKLLKAILMVCLAGDIGNLVDRTFALMSNLPTIYQHGVVDFIDITPLIPGFGIFNFADSCLTVGILMLIVYEIVVSIKSDKKETDNKK